MLMKGPLALLVLLAGMLMPCPRAETQVVVIANLSVKGAEFTKAEIRDLFTGASSTLRSGAQLTPVLLKQGTAHDDFLNRYVGKSDSAFRASWRSLVFSGEGVMPKTLDTDAAVLEYVAHTRGAVGYVEKSFVHEGVKVLAIR